MLRNFRWPPNSYEAPTEIRDVLPTLSTLASPVFHRHVRRLHWISLPIASCSQLPFHICHDLGSVASRRIDLRNILECLFSLALSQRTSRNRPSFSRHRSRVFLRFSKRSRWNPNHRRCGQLLGRKSCGGGYSAMFLQ